MLHERPSRFLLVTGEVVPPVVAVTAVVLIVPGDVVAGPTVLSGFSWLSSSSFDEAVVTVFLVVVTGFSCDDVCMVYVA